MDSLWGGIGQPKFYEDGLAPLPALKIDFWGIMPINLVGYNPHMALGPMGPEDRQGLP